MKVAGNGQQAKVEISTASDRGTCDLSGQARYLSPDHAAVSVDGAPESKVDLRFSPASVTVRTANCQASFCGGRSPGMDYTYKLKSK